MDVGNGDRRGQGSRGLLELDEPAAVSIERAQGSAPFVLTCDHAGRTIPRTLGDLGLPEAERARHIGWDIGALGVAREISRRLDAPLVAQCYSRLVIDCNRPPASEELIPLRSEATEIPGNRLLDRAAREARIDAIYVPYHAAIEALLDARAAAGRATIYVAVHSFTPAYLGTPRPWQVGVLYGSDRRLATVLLALLAADRALIVGDNEPYRIDGKDYGIPEHAIRRGLQNVLFEVRQDLITSADGQKAWGRRLAELLVAAYAKLAVDQGSGH